jgi:ACS family hexuronate transporter-like MFS transporter
MSTEDSRTTTAGRSGLLSYENGILLLLGFTFGIVFFDRNAVGILGPRIIEELGLTNRQFGMLGSGLALAWALSAYFISAWSDALRARKPFVLITIVVFSLCSAFSGLATTFMMLLVARIIMGIAEGPFLPVCLSIMNVESSPHRRGLNAGIMQNVFAALLGTTAAGVVLPLLSEAFGWRVTFFLTGVPGLICALLVWLYLKEPEGEPERSGPRHRFGLSSAFAMLKEHNIRICCLISIFMVSWFLVTLQFLVPFLEYRGFSSLEAGRMFSFMGFSTAVCGFLVPAFSDRIGRKPAMIMFCFAGLVTPLAALYFGGPTWALSLLLFVGWSGTGAFPIFMGVIPGETVSRAMAASSMGLVVCIGELVGGVAMPTVAGAIADETTLAATMAVAAVCAAGGGIIALFLRETAPSKVGTPAIDVAGAGTTAP